MRETEGGRAESAAPTVGSVQVPCRFARPTSRSTTFAVYDPSLALKAFISAVCAKARTAVRLEEQPGRCTPFSRFIRKIFLLD